MKKIPIGVIIKDIIHQKNLSVSRIAKEKGVSRQQVYNSYTRTNMHEGEIAEWAKVLDVTIDRLTNTSIETPEPQVEKSSFGDDVLQSIRKMLEEELREKNDQIRSLQKALEQQQQITTVLLGKSVEYPKKRVRPRFHSSHGNFGFGSAGIS